ncbi:hypothetical protein CALCODRAFT_504066 [Calocera cornea HHB12733]|uniref:Uncharacterized protein n=1 Tax=Calocera cornea HHB12733 TaxID=1353952 RepID=A0A165CL58_9BASI|nr:hypothetical protein CALCODRAFT_504066 [Calocera cornea HHB12733]
MRLYDVCAVWALWATSLACGVWSTSATGWEAFERAETIDAPVKRATADQAPLYFHLSSGGNENYFFRDNVTAAQVLFTSSNSTTTARRFVTAMPAGNSGALMYFLPLNASVSNATGPPLDVQLVNSSLPLAHTLETWDNVGVKGQMSFSADAQLGVAIIGAVRAMRDYVEGAGLMHEVFNYTLQSYNSTHFRLHRPWINGTKALTVELETSSNLWFNVTPGNNGTYTPPTVEIRLNNSAQPGIAAWKVVCNETSLVGLETEGLFLANTTSNNTALQTALVGLNSGSSLNAQEVSFLTFANKFTAGGWRFLTYFGRDSLIALRLMMPLLQSDAIEAALGAVLERANSTGALCHEETIGDYASFVNIGNNMSELGNTPYYDYKMIDTDLELLPALAHYFVDLPQGKNRSASFLATNATLQNGTYADLLKRNIDYNLARAAPFAQTPNVTNLIGLREGQPVGNWRDSDEGIGYGHYPFDVNSALVPASLRAIEALSLNGLIPANYSQAAGQYATVWENHSASFFQVSVTAANATSRLQTFVSQANLTSSLLTGSGSLQNFSGSTVSANDSASFYALSLFGDGRPVEVMNSDIGWNLFYGTDVDEDFITHVVRALQPYPRGLLTNVGMLVANPAFDSNDTNVYVLNTGSYHGTVVWSWQQALMAAGIARQLKFCNSSVPSVDINPSPSQPPTWCQNTGLVQGLKNAQMNLWQAINGARSEIFTEVWSYTFDNSTEKFGVADLALVSPTGTESDAIQLWSFTFLALNDPTQSL